MTKNRSVDNLPEGGSHINSGYENLDNTDEIGEGCTKEWVVKYADLPKHWEDKTFIVHALTIEGAFEHFITIKPETAVKQVRYYGIYF